MKDVVKITFSQKLKFDFVRSVDRVYLPIKLFNSKLNEEKIKQLIFDFESFLYLPANLLSAVLIQDYLRSK